MRAAPRWIVSVALACICAAPVALPAGAANAGEPASDADVVLLPWPEARSRPVLRRGVVSIWVARVDAALNLTPVRTRFGRREAKAVRAFRASQGMRPRGVVNARTWRRLGSRVPVPSVANRPVLRYGDTSAWVTALQQALGVEPASGWFGPLTLAAVRAFQTASHLPVTGVVDTATWTALGTRVTPPQVDVTTTERARTSRSHRASIGVRAFVSSATARRVVQRESNGDCTAVSPGGTYRGKWQMDSNFWSYYGGRSFAGRPDEATCQQQDKVAYRGWVDRWWQPWSTAT